MNYPPFSKVLIANRGEIAVRIMRACKTMGIATVAIYSEADQEALHVRVADQAYAVGPAPATASYLHVERIMAAARQSGAKAIHPGYGFLSERVALAQACAEQGIVFVGPPPAAIELMGSKVAAKALAAEAGVPIAPGYLGTDQSPERLHAEALKLGFPLLIKASAGGGGKGMRVVREASSFDDTLAGAKREALAAFGDDAVLLERLIERPRHIEIQVLADCHGHCVHLFERECSIQRRHQKVIEESPSVALSNELRNEMGAAAVRLAQVAGYVNAGTVEFVYAEDGSYYFLEMNTRLQVEHPVTELVTGLDLVQLQIQIAAGAPLPFRQEQLSQQGHAIEARIYAEDPYTYLPSVGTVALFKPATGPQIRNDVGLESGDQVSIYYDPMLAKLIVAGQDRQAAISRLREALQSYTVLGVTTNLPLLRAIAAHPAFLAGDTRTDFLDVHAPLSAPEGATSAAAPPAVMAALAFTQVATTSETNIRDPWAAPGWRHLGRRVRRYQHGEEQHTIVVEKGTHLQIRSNDHHWQLDSIEEHATRDSSPAFYLRMNNPNDTASPTQEQLWLVQHDSSWLIAWQGNSYQLEEASSLDIDTLGGRHAGIGGHASLEAPMPGTVVKILVEQGQHVELHQPLLVLEAMKMEHVVAAPHPGSVERISCVPGQLVMKGTTLVELMSG